MISEPEIKNLPTGVDEIVFPQLTPMEQLGALKGQIDDFDAQIRRDKDLYGITLLETEKAKRVTEYEGLLAKIASEVEFTPDKFLEALKKKGDSYIEGRWKLLRQATIRRKVLTDKFLKAFPASITNRCVKVELGKADKIVGSETMDQFVEKQTTYSYELQDLRKPGEV